MKELSEEGPLKFIDPLMFVTAIWGISAAAWSIRFWSSVALQLNRASISSSSPARSGMSAAVTVTSTPIRFDPIRPAARLRASVVAASPPRAPQLYLTDVLTGAAETAGPVTATSPSDATAVASDRCGRAPSNRRTPVSCCSHEAASPCSHRLGTMTSGSRHGTGPIRGGGTTRPEPGARTSPSWVRWSLVAL